MEDCLLKPSLLNLVCLRVALLSCSGGLVVQIFKDILQKMLSLRGITYEGDDDQTESTRPEGTMYGFTAQNIQKVFPELVTEDAQGYLQTAYGTYDAMYVEAIRALYTLVQQQQEELDALKAQTRN